MAGAADLERALAGAPGVAWRPGEAVARHSALRLGGEAEAWVVVRDEQALKQATTALRKARLTIRSSHPLGDAYAREEGLSGALLRLGPAFSRVGRDDEGLCVGAAAPLALVGVTARRLGFDGWTRLERWPGTLGAWIESADLAAFGPALRSVRVLVGRSLRDISINEGAGLSSKAILLSARLDGRLRARDPLPPAPPFPGAVCDPSPELMRAFAKSRLPGLRLRRIRLSAEQVGIVVNLGGGATRDLDLVLKMIEQRLLRDHGLEVETRLRPMGRPPGRPKNRVEGWR